MKTVAILQSCYIPWKGYFDLINAADEFVLYDDQQYTKNDWRNRNRIKTPQGSRWLTIPVSHSGRHGQRIDQARTSSSRWPAKHWKSIAQNYSRARCFEEHRAPFEALYASVGDESLSAINRRFLEAVCGVLGIGTPMTSSLDYPQGPGGASERVFALCRAAGATRYLTGPAARAYLDEGLFHDVGIEVEYADYGGYPEYPQLYPPFEHAVTILDLIFNVGADAPRYLKSFATAAVAGAK